MEEDVKKNVEIVLKFESELVELMMVLEEFCVFENIYNKWLYNDFRKGFSNINIEIYFFNVGSKIFDIVVVG